MPAREWVKQERQNAIAWARQALLEQTVILDFETTGFKGSEIVQIGIISADGTVLMDQLVKPKMRIPPRATEVHGITNEMVAQAPPLPEIWGLMSELLRGRHVVAYNVGFEEGMIAGEITRHLLPRLRAGRWSCAMQNYARFKGDWNFKYNNFRWHSLSNAVMQMGLTVDNAHSAAGDCRMTLALIQRMAECAG